MQDEDNFDIPMERFIKPIAEGGFGQNQHNKQIKIKQNNVIKNIIIKQNQSLQSLIQEFDQNFKNKNVVAYIVAKDPITDKLTQLSKEAQTTQIYDEGINVIEILNQSLIKSQQFQLLQISNAFPKIDILQSQINNDNLYPQIGQDIQLQIIYITKDFDQIYHKITINNSQSILNLKFSVKNIFNILAVDNIILEDEQGKVYNHQNNTVKQQKIINGQKIFVNFIQVDACFTSDSKIKVIEKQNMRQIIIQKTISDIKVGDQILSYSSEKQIFEKDRVSYVQTLKSDILMQIQLQNGLKVKSTTGDLFLTSEGWKKGDSYFRNLSQDINTQKLTQNDNLIYCKCEEASELKLMKASQQKIQNIKIKKYNQSVQLTHLCVEKNHNYIVNGFIAHNMFIVIQDPKTNQVFKINAKSKNLINQIKDKIFKQKQYDKKQFYLSYSNKKLQNQKSLIDYKIQKGDKLTLHFLDQEIKVEKQQKVQNKRNLILKHNTKKYSLRYEPNRTKKVCEIIDQYIEKAPRYFTLIYDNMFLKPLDNLFVIQSHSNFEQSTEIICNVVQSSERKLFYEYSLPKNYQQQIQNISEQKKRTIIKNFRDDKTNQQINQSIFKFDPTDKNQIQNFSHKLRETILCFMGLDKYKNSTNLYNIQKKEIRVFEYTLYNKKKYNGFHKRHSAGSALYFKQFFQTLQGNYKQIIDHQQKQKSTIFFFRSLSGRNLGEIQINKKKMNQVVFLPFTYFSVDHIILDNQENPFVEYIFLSEMQTLFKFDKPFILWIDDQPHGFSKTKIIEDIIKIYPDNEILQLISTRQAQSWMKQFAWLLNWQNIKFKIISDMTRFEVQNDDKPKILLNLKNKEYLTIKQKSQAAIDLIEIIAQNLGFTTLVTIFCLYKEAAKKKVTDRKLQRGANYQEIIVVEKQLIQNIFKFLSQ